MKNKYNTVKAPLFILVVSMSLTACKSGANKHASDSTATAKPISNTMESGFNATIDQKQVHLYTLKNKNGMKALITNFGGRLVSLYVPDKNNKLIDVVQGFSSVEGYQKSTEPYFGATIGRYGNRIAKGKFTLEGKAYTLFLNNGPNTLHGGKKGFQDVMWDATQPDSSSIELSYLSKDMEEGFPGNLKVKVTYTLTDDNALKISYQATTDKTTIVNLTTHAFFNLNGEDSGTILNHRVQIKADKYNPIDSTFIPTGKLEDVAGTPFDFRKGFSIGSRINDHNEQLRNGKGYDHNFVLNPHSSRTAVASVIGDKSGITMEVYTDQPGLQFYSGNFMQAKNTMKGGHKDEYRTAFAMETQHFPDSPNEPGFPSTILKPGEVYQTTSIYKFEK